MSKRGQIAAGMAAAGLWAGATVWLGILWQPAISVPAAMALSLVPGGLCLAAMIGTLAMARFFDDRIIDGQPFAPGSREAITQNALSNTVEQLVLGAALWPSAGMGFGAGLPLALGIGFGLTRLLFWAGYRIAPPLRAFGFAAGFFATILATLVSIIALLSGPPY